MKHMIFPVSFKNRSGFSLIELLVALSIIAIMVFAVTPLIIFSLQSISDSGKKSGTLFEAKGSVDIGVSEKEASSSAEMPVRFMSDASSSVNKISGGLVEKDAISVFLADAPSISLAPFVLNEGYAGSAAGANYTIVKVAGSNTHFKAGSTSISVKDKNGHEISGISALTVTSTTSASFRLPLGVGNAASPLSVRVDSKVYVGAADVKNETARTDLTINLPRYLAVGAGGANVVTDNKTNWYSRASGLSAQLNSIAWGNDRFIAAGNNGGLYRLKAGSNWSALSTGISNNINRVIWANGSFIAVGSSGLIISSNDGENWTSASSTTASDLKGVAYNGSTYAAVGNGGTILLSADKTAWSAPVSVTGLGSVNLNDIAWCNNRFIAVGDNGTIMASSPDGSIWSKVSAEFTGAGNPMGNLRKIGYNSSIIVAISGIGKIYTSSDGTAWTYRSSGVSGSIELNDIVWNDGSFFVVGASGTIITSANGTAWTSVSSPATSRLLGICNR